MEFTNSQKEQEGATDPFLNGENRTVYVQIVESKQERSTPNPPDIISDSKPEIQLVSTLSLDIIPPENVAEKSDGQKPTPVKGWRRFLGIVYTLLSVNMLSLTTTILKKFSHIHPFNVAVWSSPAAIVMSILAIIHAKRCGKKNASLFKPIQPFSEHKMDIFLLWFRAVLSSIISYLSVKAFAYITAADVRTIVSAAVIVVFIFGWLFLGEKCGVVPVIVAVVAMLGIGVMTRPPVLTGKDEFDTNDLIGTGLAFASMIVISANMIIIRHLNHIHHSVTNTVVYIWGLLQGLVLAYAFGVFQIPTMGEIVGLTIAGICLALALGFLVLALQLEEAGVVALIRTSEVIFVFFWQFILVGTAPDIISIVGATLVISGVVTVTVRKWVNALPQDNPMKKKLKFFLL